MNNDLTTVLRPVGGALARDLGHLDPPESLLSYSPLSTTDIPRSCVFILRLTLALEVGDVTSAVRPEQAVWTLPLGSHLQAGLPRQE